MLKVFAAIVIGFFALLWATGNNPASLKDKMVHWADGTASNASGTGDWGS